MISVLQTFGIIIGGIIIFLVICLWMSVNPRWVENNIVKIVLLMGFIFLIEVGVSCWRLPAEIRSGVIPKLTIQVANYQSLMKSYNELITEYTMMKNSHNILLRSHDNQIKDLHIVASDNQMRLNLFSEIHALPFSVEANDLYISYREESLM